ncbi:MAG: capsular biosynthesis protein [Pseudomonadota bacterium]
MSETETNARRVLLLEGPTTPFFKILANAFAAHGVPVSAVTLNLGDRLRGPKGARPYRGRLENFGDWLAAHVAREGITDILYYADRVPYHRIAARVAGDAGILAYAIENGYLRPDWVTLEPFGMGAFSRFPTDPDAIRAAGDAPAPDRTVRHAHPFHTEAIAEVTYVLTRLAGRIAYPHFVLDRRYHPFVEYYGWIRQLITEGHRGKAADAGVAALTAGERPFFLLPLQLADDYQIRHNSRFRRFQTFLEEVLTSFADHAPADAALAVKTHPLDHGLRAWPAVIRALAAERGIADRVIILEGGDLGALLAHTRGCVLINSTVGLTALRAGVPLHVAGAAVYDCVGLVDRQPLDTFWTAPSAPDAELFDAFERALARFTQVKGSLYEPQGMRRAAGEIAARVVARIGADPFFQNPPPRLSRARAMGVPVDLAELETHLPQ